MRKLAYSIIILSILLAACGDQENADDQTEAESATEENATESNVTTAADDEADETEEEPEANISYVEDKETLTLNKREQSLYETENGSIELAGEGVDSGIATLALKYEGELRHLWNDIKPQLRVIADDGEVYEHYDVEPRLSDEGLYILYTFDNVEGTSIERVDYMMDYEPNMDIEKDFEKVVLEEAPGEIDIPGIQQYTSTAEDLPVLEDEEKTINIKDMQYNSAESELTLTADVTFKNDREVSMESFLYEPKTEAMATQMISDEFFEGVSKELSLSYNIGHLSQYTPYVKLNLLGIQQNISLFSGEPMENNIDVVTNNEELLIDQVIMDDDNERNEYVTKPRLYKLMEDTQGNAYYNALGLRDFWNYGIGSDYKFGTYQINTGEFNTFEATASLVNKENTPSDVTLYFAGGDFTANKEEGTPTPFTGNVMEEVTLQAGDDPQDISVDLDGTGSMTIFYSTEYDGKSEVIMANGLLKE